MSKNVRKVARLVTCIAAVSVTPLLFGEPKILSAEKPSSDQRAEAAGINERMIALESKVQYASDRIAIEDVYARYLRGYDRNDMDLVRSAFWPQVQINYGTLSFTSPDEYVKTTMSSHDRKWKHYLHFFSYPYVEISGDVAHVELYLSDMNQRQDGGSYIGVARIVDRLDRKGGEWRISIREGFPEFTTETSNGMAAYFDAFTKATGKPYATSPCGYGTRDKRDPSYARPLMSRSSKDGALCAE